MGARELNSTAIPASIDWRQFGAVTPVRDQASCNGGWAFAAAATLEGSHFIQTKQLLSFSERLFINCVQNVEWKINFEYQYCCDACFGGYKEFVFRWLKITEPQINLVLENDYKFLPKNGTCEYESLDHSRVGVSNWLEITENNAT